MSLLFDESARPGATAIRELAARSGEFMVSVDAATGQGGRWLELLVNGMTFDLKGLAPGNFELLELHPHTFGLPERFNPFRYSPVTLMPGPLLAGGVAMIPVVHRQMRLAAQLCTLPGVAAVGWRPGRTLSEPGHFRRGVTRWIEGGAFPDASLAALLAAPDGGMQSEGLAFFTGQELRIEPELAADGAAAARIALRLIDELAARGPLAASRQVTGPAGEALRLDLSPNRRFVRVTLA